MVKMIITNFENLIDEEEAISREVMLSIDELRRKKYKFVITTYRNLEDILAYNKSYPFIDYIVSSFGNFIYDVSKDKFLYKKNISLKELRKVNELYKNIKKEIEAFDDKVYQIKLCNNKEKLVNSENISYYQIAKDLYITSSKVSLKEAILKLSNGKNVNITTVAYDEFDGTLFTKDRCNFVLKKAKIKNLKDNEYKEVLDIEQVFSSLK